MSFKNQVIVIILCYFLSVFFIRGFLYGIIRYQLNNSAYKKRKKGTTFREWLFYNRYTKEIPKILRILYYFVLLIHPMCLIISVFVYLMKLPFNIGEILATTLVGFDDVWILAIALLFWSPGRDFAYERWISKNRGQKRDKK